MNRRALGRGRLLVVIGALAALAGMIPPWWELPRTNASALSGNGLEGAGIIIFLGVLALIAIVVLPYATRDGDSALDRPASYVLLGLIAVGAFLLRIFEINRFTSLGLPTEAPGLWICGLGLVIIVWGVADLLVERPPAY
ncbi:MAG: hypothetical protein QOJ81_785 [Chloroflexota bacterium]|jgi:hypothetical protein|nr:hypothetical protein [Chloroflexota bacterium]